MAAKDSSVASLLIVRDNLQRDINMKDNELQRLRKILDERDRKLDEAVVQRASASREVDKLHRENDRLVKEVTVLRSEKQSNDVAIAENAAYIRKLEARLTAGGKDFLIEQNTKFKQQMQSIKAENDALLNTINMQKVELERAIKEIEILASALELRADEFNLKGDLRSGLLYEIATRRDEIKALSVNLTSKEDRLNALEFEAKEAVLRAEKSEADWAKQASAANALQLDCQRAKEEVKRLSENLAEAEHQRDVALDYVSEQAGKVAETSIRAANAERALGEIQQANAQLESRLNASDQKVAQLNSVQQVTHEALLFEKTTVRELQERSGRAESHLEEVKVSLDAARNEATTTAIKLSATEAQLAERNAEVQQLREKVARLTADFQKASDIIAHERDLSYSGESKLRAHLQGLVEKHNNTVKERDDIALRFRDANSRVAGLMVENGKLTEQVSGLQAELAALKVSSATTAAQADTPYHRSVLKSEVSRIPKAPVEHTQVHHTSPSATAEALVRQTLRSAGLDDREADKWFPQASSASQHPPIPLSNRNLPITSPGTAALEAALERTRNRRLARLDGVMEATSVVLEHEKEKGEGGLNSAHSVGFSEWLNLLTNVDAREWSGTDGFTAMMTYRNASRAPSPKFENAPSRSRSVAKGSDRFPSTAAAVASWASSLRNEASESKRGGRLSKGARPTSLGPAATGRTHESYPSYLPCDIQATHFEPATQGAAALRCDPHDAAISRVNETATALATVSNPALAEQRDVRVQSDEAINQTTPRSRAEGTAEPHTQDAVEVTTVDDTATLRIADAARADQADTGKVDRREGDPHPPTTVPSTPTELTDVNGNDLMSRIASALQRKQAPVKTPKKAELIVTAERGLSDKIAPQPSEAACKDGANGVVDFAPVQGVDFVAMIRTQSSSQAMDAPVAATPTAGVGSSPLATAPAPDVPPLATTGSMLPAQLPALPANSNAFVAEPISSVPISIPALSTAGGSSPAPDSILLTSAIAVTLASETAAPSSSALTESGKTAADFMTAIAAAKQKALQQNAPFKLTIPPVLDRDASAAIPLRAPTPTNASSISSKITNFLGKLTGVPTPTNLSTAAQLSPRMSARTPTSRTQPPKDTYDEF